MLPPPAPPFDVWPLQVTDDQAGLYLWYVRPGVFVTQLHGDKISLLAMQRLVRLMDDARELCASEIRQAGGLTAIHDWAHVRHGVDPAAGRFLKAAWKKLKPGDVNAVYLAATLDPFTEMLVRGVNFVAMLMTGRSTRLVRDIREPLLAHGIRPPSPTAAFPIKVRAG
jgi:hypothetical protein